MVEFPKIPTRFVFTGDKAKARELMGLGRKRFADLITAMGFQELETGFNTLEFEDGRRIKTSAEYGLSKIEIYVPPFEKEKRVEKEFLRICNIQAKATKRSWSVSLGKYEFLPEARRMKEKESGQGFDYKEIDSYVEDVSIMNLSQIRYKTDNHEASVMVYDCTVYSSASNDPFVVIKIDTSDSLPDFEELRLLKENSLKVSVAMSEDLTEIYYVYSYLSPGGIAEDETDVYWVRYQIGPHPLTQEPAWIGNGGGADYDAEGLKYGGATAIDREGKIYSFYDPIETETEYNINIDTWWWGEPPNASGHGGSKLGKKHSKSGEESTRDYKTFNVKTNFWENAENVRGQTIIKEDRQWDHGYPYTGGFTLYTLYIEWLSEGELFFCPASTWSMDTVIAMYYYNKRGTEDELDYGDNEISLWNGYFSEEPETTRNGYGNCTTGTGNTVTTMPSRIEKDGVESLSMTRSHMAIWRDFELAESLYVTETGSRPSVSLGWWEISPLAHPSEEEVVETVYENYSIIHPIEVDSVYSIKNSFISRDEVCEHTFYGVQYQLEDPENSGEPMPDTVPEWHIFHESDLGEVEDITEDVINAFENSLDVILSADGEETEVEQEYSLDRFEAIIFAPSITKLQDEQVT